MAPIIEAQALRKHYGKVTALDGLDLVIESGEIVAVLGPNGAGKTTFVRAVATLLQPDSGQLYVDGHDVTTEGPAVRSLIGLAGQHAAVEPTMTGRENVEMVARLYGQSRAQARSNADALLVKLGLGDHADARVKTYSGGMQRKLDLGASLVGHPRLLLLDEPTTGLDPRSRMDLWDAILALGTGGTDIVLSTQYLDEADNLASRIVIVDHGRVIADGTPAELKASVGTDVIEIHTRTIDDVDEAARLLAPLVAEVPRTDRAVRRISVSVVDGPKDLIRFTRALDERSIALDDIALRRPTLDEVFLTLTGSDTDQADHQAA